ncbi:MAG: biotin/lipoyl-containing protein, partial [Myxococcota bacterium]
TATAEGLVFRAPLAGRFYARPTPDEPPFVAAGQEIATGATVCLLEVMKTFHRVSYGGLGLPERATVARVLVSDGDDLDEGTPILALEG